MTDRQVPSYDIVAHVGSSGDRYEQVTVLVHGRANRGQLIELAEAIYRKHGATQVELIDHQTYMAGTPPLGTWLVNDDTRVREKDWSKQPGNSQVEMWEDRMQDTSDLFEEDESKSVAAVAKEYGVTRQEVQAALDSVRDWIAT